MLKNFLINKKNEDTTLLDNIFDFVVIGLVAITFANFGYSLVKHNLENISFSIANIIFISTTWYTYNFYSLRYQNKNSFHIWIMIPVIFALIIQGIGIKSFYTSSTFNTKLMLIGGFILSRLFIALIFIFVDVVNKCFYISSLVRWKYISRLLNIVIIIFNTYYSIFNVKYLFMFLALIEVLGNVFQVRDKYLIKLPPLDFTFTKTRFTKLNSLYIGSFLIASINFYSNYVNKGYLLIMLIHLFVFIVIGIFIWIIYYQRVTKFEIYNSSKTLILFSTMSIVIDIGSCLLGSTFLYVEDFANMEAKVPLIGLICFIIGLFTFLFSAKWDTNRIKVKKYKINEYLIYIVITGVLILIPYDNLNLSLVYTFLILLSLLVNYQIQNKWVK